MGIVYLLLSILFFSAMSIGVKYLDNIPFYEIIFFRSVISTICCIFSLKRKNIPIFKIHPYQSLLLARGILGTLGLCCFIICLKYLNLPYAVILHQIALIFVLSLSVIIWKKKIHVSQWIGITIAIIGIYWTYQVNLKEIDWLVTLGIAGAFFSAIAYQVIYALKGKADPSLVILYFPLTSIPLSGVFFFYEWVSPTWYQFCILIEVGITTHIAQFLLTLAYQLEEPDKLSIYNPLSVIWASIVGSILFKETLSVPQWIGICIILVGVFTASLGQLILWHQQRAKKILT